MRHRLSRRRGATNIETMKTHLTLNIALAVAIAGLSTSALATSAMAQTAADAENEAIDLLRQDEPFVLLPPDSFEALGWDLPDGGAAVKALAEAAPRGAFAPQALGQLDPAEIGYTAKWHEVRYNHYGVDWDITGLYLEPNEPVEGLPTLVQIHGGSGNWYQFFITPLNEGGLGQYMAQKIPVLLVNIPGSHKPGGWQRDPAERRPNYLLDTEFSDEELGARNAMFTFSMVTEGVALLIEEATEGPVTISAHSTQGEIPYLLKNRLRDRLDDRFFGWGTGGPAAIREIWSEQYAAAHNQPIAGRTYRPITGLRGRTPDGFTHGYVGPFSPFLDEPVTDLISWYFRIISEPDLMIDIANEWFDREFARKPFFKQHIQDMEHRPEPEQREKMIATLHESVAAAGLDVDTDQVEAEYLSTLSPQMDGYRRMVYTTSMLDEGHWDPNPERARELYVANHFREANPDAEIRVLVYDSLMTHVGYTEKPRQLAGGMLAAIKWLYEE
jgi:hypothetical protein